MPPDHVIDPEKRLREDMIFSGRRQRACVPWQETSQDSWSQEDAMAGNSSPNGQQHFPAGAVAAAAVVAASAGRRDVCEPGVARLGVVLGTGLGGLADRLDDAWSIPARDTGWLVPSTATGHAGRVVWGSLGGPGTQADEPPRCEVVMLQGRVHGYEGHAPESLSRGVELLAALGVTTVLLTNAAGGLRPDMQVGELMVLSDHIDLVRRPWTQGPEAGGSNTVQAATTALCYDPELVAGALEAARSAGSLARAGVYAHLMGPSYETRAEYRMLRKFGADVVGMSTVPEVIAARRLGLRVVAVSVVTNVARPDAPACTDAEDVCRAAAAAAEGVWAVLVRMAALTAGQHSTGRNSR
jgi:purine-nucleoside phosphorylase